mgnify:CR=1 FL=1
MHLGQVMSLSYEEGGFLGYRECTEFHESHYQLANGNRIPLVKEWTDLDSPESVSDKL